MFVRSKISGNRHEMDMCNGPLLPKMLSFAIPLMLSGILQLLFNAADIVVVGRFAGSDALAAVGSTSSLINLMINLFIGLSIGANVLAAHAYGSGKKEELKDVVHTSVATSLISGIALVFIGFVLAGPALRLMDTPEDVIDQSILYIRIYFCGMPASMAYNFGAAILRAVGDTKRPMYYLSIAGVINVGLNLIFVIVFHMGVAGVALATIASQTVSALLVLRCLLKTDGDYQLILKELKINRRTLLQMVRIGVPAGLQSMLFSISNVLIQSSVNSFGSVVMAGNTAAVNLGGFVYTALNSIYQTTLSFTSQNYGAHKFKRISRILLIGEIIVLVIGVILGSIMYLFADTLLLLYSTEQEVIRIGILRIGIVCTTYFLCGMMEVVVGSLRGMGYSIMPMLVALAGTCAFRVFWVMVVFERFKTLECLYWSYPISWLMTFLIHLICFILVFRKKKMGIIRLQQQQKGA